MLRLSEAMRLGAMLRPQTFSALFWEGGSCAIGAALEAAGEKGARFFFEVWPWVKDSQPAITRCPAGDHAIALPGGGPPAMTDYIVHLNDYHKWPRERIADWVATIEPAEEQPVENTKKEEVELCCV